MKLNSFLLMALAASTTLVACDKSENSGSNPDKMPKSVTITLPNINPQSRAIGDAIADNTKVALKNFKVYFVDASGNEQTVPQYNNAAQKTYYSNTDTDWNTKFGESNVLTYHFLPATTAKVVVVGNIGDKSYNDLATLIEDVPNDGGSGEDKHPDYPLYGEGVLTKSGAPDDGTHQNVYKASVTLAPCVSRFEIYGFEYKAEVAPDVNKYASVSLKKIALNHFYTKYNFVSKTPVEDGKVFDNPDQNTAWTWIEGRTTWCDVFGGDGNPLSELTLNPGDKKFANGTAITNDPETGDAATGIITYGLAHVANKENNPELLLALHGNTAAGAEVPLYLHAKFQNADTGEGNNGAFVSGKIYRVFFSFSDSDLDLPQRCVELNVTVDNWVVVTVTPEFN